MRVHGISKNLGGREILKSVSLDLYQGEMKVLIGPSGGGKSTLLQCMNYLIAPDRGEIDLEGRRVDPRKGAELCEFRQGDRKACKPFAQLLFRPRWADGVSLPQPLVKLTTGSWNSTAALLGFFAYLEGQARELGIVNPSLYGIPFTLSLARKTMPKRGAAFPVLSISPDCDLVVFFLRQREDLGRIAATQPRELPPASLTDPELESPDVLAADSELIVPSKPASVPADVVDVTEEGARS